LLILQPHVKPVGIGVEVTLHNEDVFPPSLSGSAQKVPQGPVKVPQVIALRLSPC
jgi:hypothetical protein